METVAETSKAEEKKTAGDDRTAVPAEDDELVVHATELISESNESSSPSVLPAGALKNSSKENFKEPVVKEERVEEVKNCFGAKIKEKLARLIKQARTLWDRLRELPGPGLLSGSDDHSSQKVQRRDRGMFPDLLSCTVEVAFLHYHFVLHAAGNVYESHRLLLCSTVRTSKPRYSNTGIRISRENTAECHFPCGLLTDCPVFF